MTFNFVVEWRGDRALGRRSPYPARLQFRLARHGSVPAEDANKYFNRRAEVWGLAADWLHAGAEIPDDPELETDLTAPQYGFSAKQQIQLEKKEDMKSRGPSVGQLQRHPCHALST